MFRYDVTLHKFRLQMSDLSIQKSKSEICSLKSAI